jgi:hypothetical protein
MCIAGQYDHCRSFQLKFSANSASVIAIYGAWTVVFWLALMQATWLIGWGSQPVAALLNAAILTGIKCWIAKQSEDSENQKEALIRLLVLTGGRVRNLNKENAAILETDNLPLWVALQSEPDDWNDYFSGSGASQFWHKNFLQSVGAKARNSQLQDALEALDRGITAAATRVEGPQRPRVLLGLRKVLLHHAAERFRKGATKQPVALISTIRNLAGDMIEGSAIKIFLDLTAAEIGYKGYLSKYHITWDDIESWLKNSPPETLDDLQGETGNKARMEMPDILKEALENERTYRGGKRYGG